MMRLPLVLLACLAAGTTCSAAAAGSMRSTKKGLVIPNWPNVLCGDFDQFKTISWWYNYRTYEDLRLGLTQVNSTCTAVPTRFKWWCYDPCADGTRTRCLPDPKDQLEFFPMIHGLPGYSTSHYDEIDPPVDTTKFKTILSFNEPNQPDQANIPAATAALKFKQIQDNYPADVKWVSPAVAGPSMRYFDAFWKECKKIGCRLDALAVHQYTGTAAQRIKVLEAYSKRYDNKPLWLTEFAMALNSNLETELAFIREFLPMLEKAPFIEKYSWWTSRYYKSNPSQLTGYFWIDSATNSLLQYDKAALTTVGKAYDYPYHLHL